MNKDLDSNFNRRTHELHRPIHLCSDQAYRSCPPIRLLSPRCQFSTARTSGSVLLDLFHCYLCSILPLTSPSSLLPTTRKPIKIEPRKIEPRKPTKRERGKRQWHR
ncbi:unnamed protein product [Malus baccata var. baccata]